MLSRDFVRFSFSTIVTHTVAEKDILDPPFTIFFDASPGEYFFYKICRVARNRTGDIRPSKILPENGSYPEANEKGSRIPIPGGEPGTSAAGHRRSPTPFPFAYQSRTTPNSVVTAISQMLTTGPNPTERSRASRTSS
jgi:hypothetical protein